MTAFDDELAGRMAAEDRAAERSDWCRRCDMPDHECRCNLLYLPARLAAVAEQPSSRECREHSGAKSFPRIASGVRLDAA